MNKEAEFKKLDKITKNLTKYAHRWGANPSVRMMAWVDTIQDIRWKNIDLWMEYCESRYGGYWGQNAYDFLA